MDPDEKKRSFCSGLKTNRVNSMVIYQLPQPNPYYLLSITLELATWAGLWLKIFWKIFTLKKLNFKKVRENGFLDSILNQIIIHVL